MWAPDPGDCWLSPIFIPHLREKYQKPYIRVGWKKALRAGTDFGLASRQHPVLFVRTTFNILLSSDIIVPSPQDVYFKPI